MNPSPQNLEELKKFQITFSSTPRSTKNAPITQKVTAHISLLHYSPAPIPARRSNHPPIPYSLFPIPCLFPTVRTAFHRNCTIPAPCLRPPPGLGSPFRAAQYPEWDGPARQIPAVAQKMGQILSPPPAPRKALSRFPQPNPAVWKTDSINDTKILDIVVWC
jgi:hypothetical protein